MSKNINFKARNRVEFETQPKPYPAVKQLPKWFTDASTTHGGGEYPNDEKLHFRSRVANYTFKKCTPLLDGMNMGYIVPLWADVMIEQNNGFPEIFWKTESNIFTFLITLGSRILNLPNKKSA